MIQNALGSKWVRYVWKRVIQKDTRARVTITVSHLRLLSFLQVASCPGHTPGCQKRSLSVVEGRRFPEASWLLLQWSSRCIARVYTFPFTRRVWTRTSLSGPGCVFTTLASGHLPFASVSSLGRTTFPDQMFSCGLVSGTETFLRHLGSQGVKG